MTVTKAYRVGHDGRLQVRGFRAHCPRCGFLSAVIDGYHNARLELSGHRRAKCRRQP
jgi:ribosomal protein S27AE